jgi:UDP-N-acetylmuramoylalanine--D-glutamate ligase
LVDNAFGGGAIVDVRDLHVHGPHNVLDALAAAALARAHGVAVPAVAAGLRAYRPVAHRLAHVADVDGVAYVDDSKATNPHAAEAALSSFASIVWIAGGQNKALAFDHLAQVARGRVRAAVLFGSCAGEVADALARHAAEIPVVRVPDLDNAVREAARLARPGDTVLLSPAAASFDMFTDYKQRGDAFVDSVRRLAGEEDQ